MKTLVVYYSLEGNTKEAAETIAKELSADLLRLVPVKDTTKERNFKFMIGGMKATFGMGTKLEAYDFNRNEYDQIILGTPVWASKPSLAVNQFLKETSNLDKITGVFTCSGGGDNDKCIMVLKKKIKNLKNEVALADKNNKELAAKNEEKLSGFIKAVKELR
ncbi:MAG TPA: flavodoxin [Lachnospiraceae bacterium]|nr:flavodoxin [Lachnospiraceae bacterium]